MTDEQTPPTKPVGPQVERSLGSVVTQYLDNVNVGAGIATGAAIVAGTAKVVKDVLPGKSDKKND
jgi:hypothetical protein